MAVKPSDIERIHHMIEGIQKIFQYTDNIDVKELYPNEMIQDAVINNFEVIGEAAYHISKELNENNDSIEWAKIQGLRHILVHDYYKINPEILWNTKDDHLNDLLIDLETIVDISG